MNPMIDRGAQAMAMLGLRPAGAVRDPRQEALERLRALSVADSPAGDHRLAGLTRAIQGGSGSGGGAQMPPTGPDAPGIPPHVDPLGPPEMPGRGQLHSALGLMRRRMAGRGRSTGGFLRAAPGSSAIPFDTGRGELGTVRGVGR